MRYFKNLSTRHNAVIDYGHSIRQVKKEKKKKRRTDISTGVTQKKKKYAVKIGKLLWMNFQLSDDALKRDGLGKGNHCKQ